MIADQLIEIYDLLYACFGPQGWWPGQTPLEIAVGAILTQNTSWTNVEKAIGNLKQARCLTAEALYELDRAHLAELIRPAGYYNLKAKRLKNFVTWLFDTFAGDLTAAAKTNTETLREQLLSIKGIGLETADSILLYAFEKQVFVVDAYTGRIAGRHGLIEPGADYETLRNLFEYSLPHDKALYNEYHALLVKCGKDYCRPKARCSGCPLEQLPHEITVY